MLGWTVLALAALQTAPAHAFFVIRSMGVLTTERLDPIVNPGAQSTHMHTVAGGSAFSANYDYAASQGATCTTTGIHGDNSNYWAPTLYHINEQGQMKAANPVINVYYKFDEAGVQPFPEGLTMLAGDAKRTSFDPTDVTNLAVMYKCLVAGGVASNGPTFPTQDCNYGVRAQVVFPSCWDGKRTTSKDRSHVVYGTKVGTYTEGTDYSGMADSNLACPEGFVRIPRLFYEFIWTVPQGHTYIPGAQNWVLSNGDKQGYSFHADFTMGWKTDLLKSALDTCGPDSGASACGASGGNCGEIKGCPVLAAAQFTPATCPYTITYAEANGVDADISTLPMGEGAAPAPAPAASDAPSESAAPAPAASQPAPAAESAAPTTQNDAESAAPETQAADTSISIEQKAVADPAAAAPTTSVVPAPAPLPTTAKWTKPWKCRRCQKRTLE